MKTCNIETPLGTMLAAASSAGICGLWFEDGRFLPSGKNTWEDEPAFPLFDKLRRWLSDYFNGLNPAVCFPLETNGSDFQQAVWNMLLEIPYGAVKTYGEIAAELAIKRGKAIIAAQAVGGAVGHNPISIIVPCHRVVGADGSLTGYGGGLERKRTLLKLEGVKLFG